MAAIIIMMENRVVNGIALKFHLKREVKNKNLSAIQQLPFLLDFSCDLS
jgi:hypothetical protein